MSQEAGNYYEVLGVERGASAQELKAAYRDLAKVWHPDRFAHDPRLQQKAQEKLKEINEAYEQLTSGNTGFHKRTASTDEPRAQRKASRATWQLAVLPLCVFMFVLLISGSLLFARREQTPPNPPEEVENREAEQPLVERTGDAVREPQRAGKKPGSRPLQTKATREPGVERAAAVTNAKPLPTVTLMIDPTNGLIATTHCPIKSRMTYAEGNAPRQHCPLHQSDPRAPSDQTAKESRLKTLTKRLASPGKWFRGKEKSGSAQRETPAANDTVNPK